jgi:hypothetical protein
MTRKNYIAAADIISSRLGDAPSDDARKAIEQVAGDLADMFRRDNAAFSFTRFYDACGMAVPSHHAGRR